MNPDYKDNLATKLEGNFLTLEDRILQDVARRIHKAGRITSTADWQINRLLILGNSSEDIENMIKEALDASYPDMFELYDQVIDWEYVRNKDVYDQVNKEFIPYEKNGYLQQLTESFMRQSGEELANLTQSLGFLLDYNGQKIMTPLAEIYQGYLDNAITDIVSGAFDYNTVIKRVASELTNSGLRTVEYASGRTARANVAARRAVMTGVSQLTGRISDYNAEKLGTDYYEVAWHAGARPTHQVWQGKVYTKEQLHTVCGLGTVTGLLGANCYHEYYPFFPGISERNWTDEWLADQIKAENTPRSYQGKEYTLYEAKQRQREMERIMRAQREKVVFMKEAHADPDQIMLMRCKYQAQLDEYSRFSKKMNLKTERARIYLDGHGRIAPSTESYRKFLKDHPGFKLLPQRRTKVVQSVDVNKNRLSILRDTYEKHRIKNNLRSVSANELSDAFFGGELFKIPTDFAEKINSTLENLVKKFDTPLCRVRTMDKMEALEHIHSFAFVRHDYSTDTAELVLNPIKLKDMREHTNRIMELSKKGYSVAIPEEKAGEYIVTHEFGHTILNMRDGLVGSRNWVGADYKTIKKARGEVQSIFDEYVGELSRYKSEKDKYELDWMVNLNEESGVKAREYVSKIDEIKISDYSLTNVDEFLAESFANEMLGVNSNSYSQRVMEVLNKYFKE